MADRGHRHKRGESNRYSHTDQTHASQRQKTSTTRPVGLVSHAQDDAKPPALALYADFGFYVPQAPS